MTEESKQTQKNCITFIQCWTNVEDVGPTLYKCYTNALSLLGCTFCILTDGDHRNKVLTDMLKKLKLMLWKDLTFCHKLEKKVKCSASLNLFQLSHLIFHPLEAHVGKKYWSIFSTRLYLVWDQPFPNLHFVFLKYGSTFHHMGPILALVSNKVGYVCFTNTYITDIHRKIRLKSVSFRNVLQIWAIFSHLQLRIAVASHNFKWLII